MFLHEATYDLEELAKHNLHVHTNMSSCAKPPMTVANIVNEAVNSGIEMIALTNHAPDGRFVDIMRNNENIREELKTCNTDKIKVLVSAELSAYGVNKYSNTFEEDMSLDYRLYTYNHYHVDFWEHPKERTAQGYKEHAFAVLTALFESKRADCIAHPFIGRFIKCCEDKTEIPRAITDNELGDIMEKGFKHKVAWELNTGALIGYPEFARRYFQIGKEIGVVFNLGTDAHRLDGINTFQFIDRLKKILY